jgi:hypothetical protein
MLGRPRNSHPHFPIFCGGVVIHIWPKPLV